MADNKTTFDIEIRTDAKLEAYRSTLRELQTLRQAAVAAGRDTAAFDSEIKGVNKSMGERTLEIYREHLRKTGVGADEAAEKLRSLEKAVPMGVWDKAKREMKSFLDGIPIIGAATRSLNGSTGLVAGIFGAFVGGGAAAIKTVKAAIAEFDKLQASVIRMERTLVNMGQMSPEYSQGLQELASTLAKGTGTGGEEWIDALTRLTAAGADGSNIGKYAEGVKNLAGILGGDIPQASMLMQRAMIGNFDMVSRAGVVFQATGDKAADLDAFLRAVATQGGGLMEDRLKTISGKAANLSEAFNNVLEGIGNLISRTGIAQEVLDSFAHSVDALADLFPKTTKGISDLDARLMKMSPISKEAAEALSQLAKKQSDELAAKTKIANDEIQRQLDLFKKQKQHQLEMEDIQLAIDTENIDNNEELSDEEKLKKKSEAREASEKRKLDINREVNQGTQDAAANTLAKLEGEIKARKDGIVALEKQMKDATDAYNSVVASANKNWDAEIKPLEDRASKAKKRLAEMESSPFVEGYALHVQAQITEEAEGALTKAKESRKNNPGLYSLDESEQKRQREAVDDASQKYKAASGRIGTDRTALEEQVKGYSDQIESLRGNIASLKADRSNMDELAAMRTKQRAQTQNYALRTEQKAIAQREAENVDLPQAEARLAGMEGAAAKILPGKLKGFKTTGTVTSEERRAVASMRSGLANATKDKNVTEGEMDKLIAQAQEAQKHLSSNNRQLAMEYIATVQAMNADLVAARQQIKTLREQLKNRR